MTVLSDSCFIYIVVPDILESSNPPGSVDVVDSVNFNKTDGFIEESNVGIV